MTGSPACLPGRPQSHSAAPVEEPTRAGPPHARVTLRQHPHTPHPGHGMLPAMTDTTPPPRARRFSRRQKAAMVLLLLLVWSLLANQWQNKGCLGTSGYRMVLSHGTPDADEGCDLDWEYTNHYSS